MSEYYLRNQPYLNYGMRKAEMTDLYRAKYGLPLDGENHERFIATKVPYRKNKDYRPRFRNYSFGYPTYKKDNYTRHWYNFLDILHSDAPAIKYAKAFVGSYICASIYNLAPYHKLLNNNPNGLDNHKVATSVDYVKKTQLGMDFKKMMALSKGPSTAFAVYATVYTFLFSKFKDWQYSSAQAHLRASFLITLPYVLIKNDRPHKNFFYASTVASLWLFITMYGFFVQRFWRITGPETFTSEKFYLKNVSPEEIVKIEYQDRLQNLAKMYEMSNILNYNELKSALPQKYSVISP